MTRQRMEIERQVNVGRALIMLLVALGMFAGALWFAHSRGGV
jgi:hypothetical protein